MISGCSAVEMIEDELDSGELNNLRRKHLDGLMTSYASQLVRLIEEEDLKKLETQLMITNRLFSEATVEIRAAIEKIVGAALLGALKQKPDLLVMVRRHLGGLLIKASFREESLES